VFNQQLRRGIGMRVSLVWSLLVPIVRVKDCDAGKAGT
jgi:hypothetical protein